MEDAIEKFKVGDLTVSIHHDTDAGSPLEWDNLGTMVCWHRNYDLGDKHGFKTPQDFEESDEYQNAAIILPLRLYDHSGITMSVGSGPSPFDPGGWDSGQVGWIYVSREKVRDEYSVGEGLPIPEQVLTKAEKVLRGEVETYDQFLTGDVYGYQIEDEDGNDVDSCWGFFGIEDARQQATGAAESAIKHEAEEVEKIRRCMAL